MRPRPRRRPPRTTRRRDRATASAPPHGPARGSPRWLAAHRTTIALHVTAVLVTVFVIRVVGSGFAAGYPPFFPDSSSFAAVARRGPVHRPVLVRRAADRLPAAVLGRRAQRALRRARPDRPARRRVRRRRRRRRAHAALAASPSSSSSCSPSPSRCSRASRSGRRTCCRSRSPSRPGSRPSPPGGGSRRHRPAAGRSSRSSCRWRSSSSRDSNVVVVAVTVIPALARRRVALARGAARRRAGRCSPAPPSGSCVCGYVTISQDVADRNIYPVINNVGQRILPDAGMTDWFEARGMPLDDALRAHTGDDAFDDGSAMLNDPALAEFRDVGGRRRPTVAADLLRPPRAVLVRAARRPPRRAARATTTPTTTCSASATRLGSPGPRRTAVVDAARGLARRGRRRPRAGVVAAAAARPHRRRRRGRRRRPARRLRVLRRRLAWRCSATSSPRSPGCRSPSCWPSGSGSRRSPRRRARRSQPTSDEPPTTTSRRRLPWPRSRRPVGVTVVGLAHDRARHDDRARRVLRQRAARAGLRPAVHEGARRPRRRARRQLLRGRAAQQGPVRAVRLPGRRVPHVRRRLLARRSRRSSSSPPLLCAVAVATTARAAGTSRLVAARGRRRPVRAPRRSSRADYSGVLYSRNMTDRHPRRGLDARRLVAWPWTGSAAPPARRRRRHRRAARAVRADARHVGVRGGGRRPPSPSPGVRREHRPEWRRAAVVLAGCRRADGARAARLVRACAGRFAEFWGGWWIYGSYQSAGLGRSLFAQFGLAWDQAYAYYRTWPLSALVARGRRRASPSCAGRSSPPAQRAIRLGVARVGRRRVDRAGPRPALLVALLLDPRPADVAGRGDGGRRPRARSPRPAASRPALRAAAAGARRRSPCCSRAPRPSYRDGIAAASDFTGVDDLAARPPAAESRHGAHRAGDDRPRQPARRPAAGLDRATVDVPAVGPHRGDPVRVGQLPARPDLPRRGGPAVRAAAHRRVVRRRPRPDRPAGVRRGGRAPGAAGLPRRPRSSPPTSRPSTTGRTERVYVRRDAAAELLEPAADGAPWEPEGEAAPGWVAGDGDGGVDVRRPTTRSLLDRRVPAPRRRDRRRRPAPRRGSSSTTPAGRRRPASASTCRRRAARRGRRRTPSSSSARRGRPPTGPVPFSIVVGADSVALVVDGRGPRRRADVGRRRGSPCGRRRRSRTSPSRRWHSATTCGD